MPRVGATGMSDLMTFGKLALKLRLLGKQDMLEFFRVATLPMRDLLDELPRHSDLPIWRSLICKSIDLEVRDNQF